MKNYHEMAENILSRREAYIAQKRTLQKRWMILISCLCLCTLIGAGIWQSGVFGGSILPASDETEWMLISPQTNKDILAENSDNTELSLAIAKNLSINEIDAAEVGNIFSNASLFNLSGDMLHEMSREEMLNYLGIDFDLSDSLPEFSEREDAIYGYYVFEDGWIWDQQDFYYVGENERTVNIVMRKGDMPFFCATNEYYEQAEKSMIDGYRIMAVHYEENGIQIHYAEFMKNNVGITIFTENLTADEFADVLAALLSAD